MTRIDRRSVLVGSLGGVSVGGISGWLSAWLPERARQKMLASAAEEGAKLSYAQQGEDLVVADILERLAIVRPTYLDVGAHHPSIGSNTFLFYKGGGHGVLVEPNPAYADLLRKRRSGDVVLEVGVGTTAAREADYYVVGNDDQLNTFSKEQADGIARARGARAITRVMKRALVRIDDILAQHFPSGGPDFLSIDVEGLDLAILRTLDFGRFRPKVLCVETATQDGGTNGAIQELLARNGYGLCGGSLVNSVFVEQRQRAPRGDAG
jgi:FkbM family methyltransferase